MTGRGWTREELRGKKLRADGDLSLCTHVAFADIMVLDNLPN